VVFIRTMAGMLTGVVRSAIPCVWSILTLLSVGQWVVSFQLLLTTTVLARGTTPPTAQPIVEGSPLTVLHSDGRGRTNTD
jgi:hypothetical protein